MVQVGLLLVMVAAVSAYREVEFKNCKTTSGSLSCKVKNVKIEGCLEPSSWVDVDGSVVEYQSGNEKNPCRIESGFHLNISVTFEPGYNMENVRSQLTLPDMPECWGVQEPQTTKCPVSAATVNGCEHTKCPLQAGRQQRYEIQYLTNTNLPPRSVNDRKIYQLRWKLWNNKDKKHSCCFNIPIQY